MKDKTLNIRCSDFFLERLNYFCNYYKLSQSDLLEVLLFSFNDYALIGKVDDKFYKYVVKQMLNK